MPLKNAYLTFVKYLLPSPFTIAILLTVLTFILAFSLTTPTAPTQTHSLQILGFWEKGIWELLAFSMQMVLILVLGHALALTPLFGLVVNKSALYCKDTATSAFIISFTSILVSFFNWGLCLIIGAVFARKVAENALKNGYKINYPILGAAGYSGLMTWHGGLSGSAPLTVAGKAHFLSESIGQINISETVLSSMNITTSLLVITIIPVIFYWLGKGTASEDYTLTTGSKSLNESQGEEVEGAEKLDSSGVLPKIIGTIIVAYALYKGVVSINTIGFNFINLNYINLLLFGLCILFHRSFKMFISAVTEAVTGATGIIIQFPLYAGIMGIMKYSGLIHLFSDFFISISNQSTFPIFTFISAAIVNTFVPSGGGQWAVQGPIVTNAALALKVPISKVVMALSYGDQLTNMLQPFWALPLLGITQLKAKDILPYSFIIMLIGASIYISMLWLF